MILYKSLPKDRKPHGFNFKLNKWHKIEGELEICKNGFHASKKIIDAMCYVDCEYIAKVEVRGESQKEDDKQAWSEMRILEWHKWTKKDSVSLAIFAAELVLKNFEKEYPEDMRPREAIEAAKKVLKSDTAKNRSAAWSATGSAAWSAKSAAKSAAWSAKSAAESARLAGSAAWSAKSAAESARLAGSAKSARLAWSARSAAWSAKSAAESARLAAGLAGLAVMNKCHKFVINRKFK